MKENLAIMALFEDLFDGDPWLDVTLAGTLRSITAGQASTKPSPFPNSIWEIVNHIIAWRENVLRRVHGEVIVTPAHNYFQDVGDISEAAWEITLLALQSSQDKWLAFLSDADVGTFPKLYPTNRKSYFDHIHGIIQHDAYHLGQIVMLSKHLSAGNR